MKALILAAGQGNRLEAITENLPKALVEVAGRPLLGHQLNFLKHPAIEKIAVVTGTLAPQVTSFLKKECPNATVFHNPDFKEGSILTLKAALSFLDDDFLLMNVDHIYPKPLLDRIVEQAKDLSACCDFDRKLASDDMKIKKDAKGNIKEIHKGLKNYDGGYIGMTFCAKSKIAVYRKAMENTLEKLGPKISVEMILGELAQMGEAIHIIDTSGIRWLEVDTPEDLKVAEKTFNEKTRL